MRQIHSINHAKVMYTLGIFLPIFKFFLVNYNLGFFKHQKPPLFPETVGDNFNKNQNYHH